MEGWSLVGGGGSAALLVDCRPAAEYAAAHARGALSAPVPASAIMLRRLERGRLPLPGERLPAACRARDTVLLYDRDSHDIKPPGSLCVLSTLYRRLKQDGAKVFWLPGGFEALQASHPDLLESGGGDEGEQLSLAPLRISGGGGGEGGYEAGDEDPPFPVEILPYLFLGNGENARDWGALQRHKIRYVLNVTPNLANAFEDRGIRYMNIPIQDHWSEDLATFFPEAIAFIDEARQQKACILVHCVAGISRSVTITIAYLMQKLSLPLNEAYDFVRQRKANISPNFHFMGQLMELERQLHPQGTTPDSGIDVDHWT